MFGYSAKRPRDADALIDLDESAFRDKKKLRPLTLRTPSNTSQQPFSQNRLAPRFRTSALTPVESSDEEGENDAAPSNSTDTTRVPQPLHEFRPFALAVETGMDVDTGKDLPPLVNGDNLSPWPTGLQNFGGVQPSAISHSLVNQLNLCGQHTPITTTDTPVQGYFPNLQATDPMDSDSGLLDGSAKSQTAWYTRQRLPSPISEDEDCSGSNRKASPNDAEMAYNSSRPASPPCEAQKNDSMQLSSMAIDQPKSSANASPSKKKVTISMGYRADCDKCRRKVPGHYSHFIRP